MNEELNIETTADSIGADLFGGNNEPEPSLPESDDVDLGSGIEPGTDIPVSENLEPTEAKVESEPVVEETLPQTGAPKTWRKEAQAAYDALPQVVKDEVLKREEDMYKGLEQYKQGATIGDNFKNVVTPHMEHLQRAGVNVYEEVNGLLEYGKIMRFGTMGEKISLLSTIAQEYGVDLLELADHGNSAPYIDPTVKALQSEINALKSGRQQELTQREVQLRNENQARIEAFKYDPKHEHFSTLEPEMAAFISSGVCRSLEEAYEKALWANPLTRAKEQQRQTAELKAQSQAKAEAAKKATAANLKTNARPGSATTPKGSMDDTLAAQMQEIRSRSQ